MMVYFHEADTLGTMYHSWTISTHYFTVHVQLIMKHLFSCVIGTYDTANRILTIDSTVVQTLSVILPIGSVYKH